MSACMKLFLKFLDLSMKKMFVCKIFQQLTNFVWYLKKNYIGRCKIQNKIKYSVRFLCFSKEETDEEAVEIRQKCEDYVLSINDLQSQILFVKTPIRRVNSKRLLNY
jgi:hypothetical protein